MTSLSQLLDEADREALDDRALAVLDRLRLRARRETGCRRCRGYGWYVEQGLPPEGEGHADRVFVCACSAGHRFWALALHDTDGVVRAMELDVDQGTIASSDGLFGRFGMHNRSLLRALAVNGGAECAARWETR